MYIYWKQHIQYSAPFLSRLFHTSFICTLWPLQQPAHMLLFFLLGFFTTTSAAATTTGFAGICLSDVLSSLAEKHNLGLIGVSRCKELRSDYRGVCRTDVSAATALRGTAPLIGRWEPGSCPSWLFFFLVKKVGGVSLACRWTDYDDLVNKKMFTINQLWFVKR